ncbi:hypothetical protein HY312_04910 [Candidatus Saccharibacteria bacterium]|nr:hypothetical protein [Candidatus Saccharibacteria bacterium]
MLKKSTSSLTAQKLRLLLIISIFFILLLTAGIFAYARSVLATYSSDVQKVSDTAASSSKNLSALNTLKTKLAENKDAVERAKNLVAESQSYAYQDQIIKDLNTFASKSGVTISGFQFNSEATGAAGATPAATPSTTTTATPAPAAGGAATAPTGGLKTVSASINLKSPVNYKNIMNFVHMIEQNLTKMQLTGIALNKDTASNNVSVNSLTVEVYVR